MDKIIAMLEALKAIPDDVPNQWGSYPSHNEAAEMLGITTNGSRAGKICDVRLGVLANARAKLEGKKP